MSDILPHDPGGKVRIVVPPHIQSAADFSDDMRHRFTLERWHKGHDCKAFILWIMMNPSTADERVDDPTLRRVRTFTEREGFSRWVVCNVMSYRMTDSTKLKHLTVADLCPMENLEKILRVAKKPMCARIVLGFGAPKSGIVPSRRVIAVLKDYGQPLWCLDRTTNGSPKHPLYVASNKAMEIWRPEDWTA